MSAPRDYVGGGSALQRLCLTSGFLAQILTTEIQKAVQKMQTQKRHG